MPLDVLGPHACHIEGIIVCFSLSDRKGSDEKTPQILSKNKSGEKKPKDSLSNAINPKNPAPNPPLARAWGNVALGVSVPERGPAAAPLDRGCLPKVGARPIAARFYPDAISLEVGFAWKCNLMGW
ncbi:hypothetical protein JTE90_015044 [Oedothorax gibbosus]|uniref:Uncharacterized protein n=1 Tax=Oedothorax gibbosus TaxID=931172 RepID=A0AAV6TMG9_9ARAC|nr:hypothetical protein JTE90_015044 [Oedothorax gibbosus]